MRIFAFVKWLNWVSSSSLPLILIHPSYHVSCGYIFLPYNNNIFWSFKLMCSKKSYCYHTVFWYTLRRRRKPCWMPNVRHNISYDPYSFIHLSKINYHYDQHMNGATLPQALPHHSELLLFPLFSSLLALSSKVLSKFECNTLYGNIVIKCTVSIRIEIIVMPKSRSHTSSLACRAMTRNDIPVKLLLLLSSMDHWQKECRWFFFLHSRITIWWYCG